MMPGSSKNTAYRASRYRALQGAPEIADKAASRRVARLLELPLLNRPLLNFLDLRVHRLFDRRRIAAGRGHRFEVEQPRALRLLHAGVDLHGHLLLPHEAVVEPGAAARPHHRRQRAQRVHVGMQPARHLIGRIDERETRERILDHRSPFFLLRRLGRIELRRRAARTGCSRNTFAPSRSAAFRRHRPKSRAPRCWARSRS